MSQNINSRNSPPLCLMGAPGAGKGTQARVISMTLGIPHISTGAILRQNVQQGTSLGQLAKAMVEKGELVTDADGARMEQRADDRAEAIRERMATYERQTAPLVDFYRNEGGLLEVNGEQGPEAISGELQRLLAS